MKQQDIQTTKKNYFSKNSWLLIIGIIFIAFTLRSPLTSVGPIIAPIRDDLGISNFLAGFLTTIPLLAFALISPFASKLSHRFGIEITLFVSLLLLTIGIILRSLGSVPLLLSGTFLIGVAIAFGNVLLPGLLKLSFPLRVGLITGVYSIAMSLSATLASGVAVPIASGTSFGWQGALGVWAVLSLAALIIWIPQIKDKRLPKQVSSSYKIKKTRSLLRSPLAWSVTFFMGLQSFIFYTTSAWLPEILKADGLSASHAGWMLSLLQFSQLPMMFIIPIIADKIKDQRKIVVPIVLLYLIGYGGVWLDTPSLTALWMIIIGIAGGASFGLAMMFFTLRTHTPFQAADLSGMAQSIGYSFAAIGPVLFGTIHDLTANWTTPMSLFFIATILLFLSGMKAGVNEFTLPNNK